MKPVSGIFVSSFSSLACRAATKAVALLMQCSLGRRIGRHLFKDILGLAPDELAPQLVEEFIGLRPELAAAQLVRTRPDLVERELINAIPRLALRQECYSQEGEDLVIARLFDHKRDGFYVDVGAHHPIRFSNTYLLYRLGWRGINVDAAPGSMEAFRRLRQDDINIECLVSSRNEVQEFYVLNEPALSTGSLELAHQRSREDPRYAIVHTATLKPRTLASILDEYLPPGCAIDLLNVDVEGLDLDVLQSNDWARYRPSMVLAEILLSAKELPHDEHPLARFLYGKGYRMISRFYNVTLFQLGAEVGAPS